MPLDQAGGGVLGLYQAAVRVYRGTAGSRNDLAKRLNQLAAGVTVRYVEERFGTPAFARTIVLPRNLPSRNPTSRHRASGRSGDEPGCRLTRPQPPPAPQRPMAGNTRPGNSRRSGYWCTGKSAWIQVLVDDDDAVARFSITVTDPKFKFPVRDLTCGHIAIKLGHSRFADVQPGLPLDGRSLRIGAHTTNTPRLTGSTTQVTTSTTS